jgi:hypothetical protein
MHVVELLLVREIISCFGLLHLAGGYILGVVEGPVNVQQPVRLHGHW